jgi:endoglucanase
LLNASNTSVANGQTQRFGLNAGSGQVVHSIDFSAFTTPGAGYVLDVSGVRSHPFDIGGDVYDQLKYDALAFFYHQRASIAIEAQYVGATWARPVAHDPDAGGCIAIDFRGNDWGGCPYTLDVSRGWYDAGDQGKYVVNGGIAVWTLQNYYERIRDRAGVLAAFDDGSMQIPERANGFPDLLDEARWEMDFMLAMQVPDGTTLNLPRGNQNGNLSALTFSSVDASGMAHHKFHDVNWTGLPTAPHLDAETRYLSYPSTAATLNLAASAAQCARLWRGIDDTYADRCLDAATRAYAAAKRLPDVFAIDVTQGGGGAYGDFNVSDEFYWAATELFITTGDAAYEADMRASPHFMAAPAGSGAGDIAWPSVQALGTISLAIASSTVSNSDRSAARAAIVGAADAYFNQIANEGYLIPFSRSYVWGSNGDFSNRGIILALAHDFSGDARYRDGVVHILDYLLGRNPLNFSYIAGHGENAMMQPHHRFWANAADASFPPPPAGALGGGSNNRSPGADDVATSILPTCFAQTCYRDDWRAFSLNEVAVNWNAPLFWIAAYADEP